MRYQDVVHERQVKDIYAFSLKVLNGSEQLTVLKMQARSNLFAAQHTVHTLGNKS